MQREGFIDIFEIINSGKLKLWQGIRNGYFCKLKKYGDKQIYNSKLRLLNNESIKGVIFQFWLKGFK